MERRMPQIGIYQQDMTTKLGKRYRKIRRGRGFTFACSSTGHKQTPDWRLSQLNPGAHRMIGLRGRWPRFLQGNQRWGMMFRQGMARDKTQERERQILFNLSHMFEALIESLDQQSEASPTSQAEY